MSKPTGETRSDPKVRFTTTAQQTTAEISAQGARRTMSSAGQPQGVSSSGRPASCRSSCSTAFDCTRHRTSLMGGVCLIVLLNGHPSTGCPAARAAR